LKLFRALTHRPFALLWAGQTISRVGDHLYEVALAWWVLQETGSALAMSMVLALAYAPMLLFLLIGGVAVDRLPRARLMLAADGVRGAAMLVLAALAAGDALQLWQVYAASVLFGLTDALFQPAYTALTPELTPEADWPSANSLSSMSMQLGRVAGPALAGLLVSIAGIAFAFAINAVSFFCSAAFLLPLWRGSQRPERAAAAASPLADLRAGLATVAVAPVLWISILVFALTNVTLSGPYSVALPFLVTEHMGGDARTLGLLYAVFPLGYLLGGVWLGRRSRLRRRGVTMAVGAAVAGGGILALGLPVPLAVVIAAALANGAALEVAGLTWTNVVQTEVPAERLGRVASLDMLGSFILLPVGFGLTGVATEQWGPALVFVGGGLLTVLISLAALGHPAIRRLD
jgi:DHA3 family tetracycline resistance protein-like MFS transporter